MVGTRGHVWTGGVLGCVLVLATTTVAGAQAAPQGAYRETITEAVREFTAGRWAEARALFKHAHALSPNARTLRGMGMTAYEMRLYVAAVGELERALSERRRPLTAEQRAQAEALVEAARRFIGRYRLVLSPMQARLTVDGKAPTFAQDGTLMLDAGAHELRLEADGYEPGSQRLRVDGGESATLELTLRPQAAPAPAAAATPAPAPLPIAPPTPPASDPGAAPSAPAPAPPVAATPEASAAPASTAPAPAPAPVAPPEDASMLETLAWASLVGAAGFGAASGVFWIVGEGQYTSIENKCRTSCTVQEIDDSGVETSDLLTNTFLGLSILSGITGVVLFAVDANRSGRHDSLALRAAPEGVALGGSF